MRQTIPAARAFLGSAPVLGSGCGVAGGGDTFNGNGGWPPSGMTQGA